jgi:glycine cleavage system H protein
MNPSDRKYSKEHEWIKLEDGSNGLVGITDYAQDQLGDVVYLDLPASGTQLEQFGKFGEIESVKAVNDLFSPVSGAIIESNPEVVEKPELVNEDPYAGGWLLRLQLSDPSELEALLTAEEYEAFTAESAN